MRQQLHGFPQNHRAAWPPLYRRIYMNAHCGLWQRECDLNTRVMVSKTIALTAWLSRYIPTGSFEWCPAPYRERRATTWTLAESCNGWWKTSESNRSSCSQNRSAKPLHFVLHLVAGLFILSPAIRVEEHYLSLYLIALVRSCLLTSCIVS